MRQNFLDNGKFGKSFADMHKPVICCLSSFGTFGGFASVVEFFALHFAQVASRSISTIRFFVVGSKFRHFFCEVIRLRVAGIVDANFVTVGGEDFSFELLKAFKRGFVSAEVAVGIFAISGRAEVGKCQRDNVFQQVGGGNFFAGFAVSARQVVEVNARDCGVVFGFERLKLGANCVFHVVIECLNGGVNRRVGRRLDENFHAFAVTALVEAFLEVDAGKFAVGEIFSEDEGFVLVVNVYEFAGTIFDKLAVFVEIISLVLGIEFKAVVGDIFNQRHCLGIGADFNFADEFAATLCEHFFAERGLKSFGLQRRVNMCGFGFEGAVTLEFGCLFSKGGKQFKFVFALSLVTQVLSKFGVLNFGVDGNVLRFGADRVIFDVGFGFGGVLKGISKTELLVAAFDCRFECIKDSFDL